jgi:BMFP domain-containing protein YqiC
MRHAEGKCCGLAREAARRYGKIGGTPRTGIAMAQSPLFEEMDRRIREILAQSPAADLERNLKALLQSFFARLDLVTSEEFEVQREVLARARARLEELEARVAELEKKAYGKERGSETGRQGGAS